MTADREQPRSAAGGEWTGWPGRQIHEHPASGSGQPRPAASPGRPAPASGRQTPATARPAPASGGPSPAPASPATTAVRREPRRARLAIKRIDPWTTLKFAAVYSLALLVVLLVAVIALYAIVDAMGVIDSIRTFLRDIDPPKPGHDVASFLSFWRILGMAFVIGIVNVILVTAIATLSAFVYNICSDLVGGVEITLTERE